MADISSPTTGSTDHVRLKCPNCSKAIIVRRRDTPAAPPRPQGGGPALAASSGLARMFGLHPMAAVLTVLVDILVFGGNLITVGLLLPVSVCSAGVLGWVVYRIQRSWYGDDHDSAIIKAVLVALLTAIPAPLSPVIALPAGGIGIIDWMTRPRRAS